MAIVWTTLVNAQTVTGNTSITEANLERAQQDVYDEIRWVPVLDEDFDTDSVKHDAMGRAIAWQALRWVDGPPDADQGGASVTAESIGDYSVSYENAVPKGGMMTNRSRDILKRYGLYRMTGRTGGLLPQWEIEEALGLS